MFFVFIVYSILIGCFSSRSTKFVLESFIVLWQSGFLLKIYVLYTVVSVYSCLFYIYCSLRPRGGYRWWTTIDHTPILSINEWRVLVYDQSLVADHVYASLYWRFQFPGIRNKRALLLNKVIYQFQVKAFLFNFFN